MRTERVVLFGTHFFCVLEWARFLKGTERSVYKTLCPKIG